MPERPATASAAASPRPTFRNHAPALLQVLAAAGYGIWLWLGLSLLLGLNRLDRSGILIPLALGAVLAGAGLLLACLRLPGLGRWHGWQPRPGHRPTYTALMAMVTWLPMLAVAGLAHGDNRFWATRLAGALLMLCCVVSLLQATHDDRARLSKPMQRATALLPVCRITAAIFTGGLWLWLCALAQASMGGAFDAYVWTLLLLSLALGLGLLDSGLWQALRDPEPPLARTAAGRHRFAWRLLAALLAYALPCVALLLGGTTGNLTLAALAAPGCLLGRLLDRYLYENALADAGAGASPA